MTAELIYLVGFLGSGALIGVVARIFDIAQEG